MFQLLVEPKCTECSHPPSPSLLPSLLQCPSCSRMHANHPRGARRTVAVSPGNGCAVAAQRSERAAVREDRRDIAPSELVLDFARVPAVCTSPQIRSLNHSVPLAHSKPPLAKAAHACPKLVIEPKCTDCSPSPPPSLLPRPLLLTHACTSSLLSPMH